jgi:hypothetical protein
VAVAADGFACPCVDEPDDLRCGLGVDCDHHKRDQFWTAATGRSFQSGIKLPLHKSGD